MYSHYVSSLLFPPSILHPCLFLFEVSLSWPRVRCSLHGVWTTPTFSCFGPIPCGLHSCRNRVYFCLIHPGTLFHMHCHDFHGKWVLFGVSSSSSAIWPIATCLWSSEVSALLEVPLSLWPWQPIFPMAFFLSLYTKQCLNLDAKAVEVQKTNKGKKSQRK